MSDDTLTGQEPSLSSEPSGVTQRSMAEIGVEINTIVQTLQAVMIQFELTPEELARFARYVENQHTVAPILDPTAYRNLLYSGGFDELERRITAIREVLRLCKEKE
jgi:hypothetical protein